MNEDGLDGGQDDAGVDVLKLRYNPLANVLGLLLVDRPVVGQGAQDSDASPLCALVESHEELLEGGRGDDECSRLGGRLGDFGQGLDRIGDHHGVRIANQLLQGLEEAVFYAHGGVQVKELGDADGRRLANVGRLVPQCLA